MLIEWIYGEAGPPPQVDAGRLQAWDQAFQTWLDGSSSSAVRDLRLYSWRCFIEHLGKPPWEVSTAQVDAWTEAGRQVGRSNGWLKARLADLASFYDFCAAVGFDPAYAAVEHPLRTAVKPKVTRYRDLNYLSWEEAQALLEAIREDGSLLGKRDYALFSLLLLSGRRVMDAGRLRWGDLEFCEGEISINEVSRNTVPRNFVPRIRWPNSPLPPQEMPAEAWVATWNYLSCSGRLPSMQPDWRLFPPLVRGFVFHILEGKPEEWSNPRALGRSELTRLLRQYARWAGLQAEKLRFIHLRNTAALHMAASGLSLSEMCSRLGIVHKRTLYSYLGMLKAQPKPEFWSAREPQPHRPRGHARNEQPRLKHGVYAHSLPQSWLEELFEVMPELREIDFEEDPLLWEFGLRRLISMKLTEVTKDEKSLDVMLRYLDLLGRQGSRMARLVSQSHRQRKERREKQEIERQMAELLEKLGGGDR